MPVVLRSNPYLFGGLGKPDVDLGVQSLYVGDALLDDDTVSTIDKVKKWATYRALVRLMDHPDHSRVRLDVEITDAVTDHPNGIITFDVTRGTLYNVLSKGVDTILAEEAAELEGT